MNLRHAFESIGTLIDALLSILTLGSKQGRTCQYWCSRLWFNIKRWFQRRRATKNWNATTFRIKPEGGTYITREGRTVEVKPNTEEWFDKLAFIVNKRWTVDERGFAYPASLETPFDIVSEA